MTEGVVLTAVGFCVSAVVWFVRLEGRVNGHDREHGEHIRRHEELRNDLAYIRERIDTAINGRHNTR